jgi:hypothetical protein
MPVAAPAQAVLDAYETCLLAMARAVENAGMYGVSHPTAQSTVNHWFRLLGPLIRSHGTLTLESDGHTALINGVSLSNALTNPLILSLLRKLYTTRAGRLELLSGFNAQSAGLMVEFLATADATRPADEEHAFKTWIMRRQIRHVRVSPLRLVEVKDDDRIVSGVRKRPTEETKPAAGRPSQEAIAAWAAEFQQDSDRAGRAAMPRKVLTVLVGFLRGTSDVPPAGMADCMTRAAANPAQLSELILKSALVQQELTRRFDGPVGDDVVAGLRSVVNALQETQEARTDDGWRNVARILSAIEACILERLQTLAGGTEHDAEVIRGGVRAIQREIEGAALKREYEQRRNALLAVEHRIRKFFGLDPGSP